MHALKDITLGLWQVHKEIIAHQDGKPSNVLAYPGPSFKVADFGRSSRKGQPAAHDDFKIAGDRGYAPPEQLFGFVHPEFINRRIGCDLYMLGNLAAFLFSGVNITPLLLSKLDPQHHPRAWSGNYEQVLPYVRNAFSAALADVSPLIDERVSTDVLGLVVLWRPSRGSSRGVHRAGRGRDPATLRFDDLKTLQRIAGPPSGDVGGPFCFQVCLRCSERLLALRM